MSNTTTVEIAQLSATGIVLVDALGDGAPIKDATILLRTNPLDPALEHHVRTELAASGADAAIVYAPTFNDYDIRVLYVIVRDGKIYRHRSLTFCPPSIIALNIDYDEASEKHMQELNPRGCACGHA